MSIFSWAWATREQRDFFVEIKPHFRSAQLNLAENTFYKALREQWFARWPILPELIARGLLPPEAAEDGYVLNEEQAALVRHETDEKFKRIRITMLWARFHHMLYEEAGRIEFTIPRAGTR